MRFPVEARLTAHKYFSGMLHLHGEPLDLVCHATASAGDLELTTETLDGKQVQTHQIGGPDGAGLTTTKLSLYFPLVGNYRARLFSESGAGSMFPATSTCLRCIR